MYLYVFCSSLIKIDFFFYEFLLRGDRNSASYKPNSIFTTRNSVFFKQNVSVQCHVNSIHLSSLCVFWNIDFGTIYFCRKLSQFPKYRDSSFSRQCMFIDVSGVCFACYHSRNRASLCGTEISFFFRNRNIEFVQMIDIIYSRGTRIY